jgi:hypothetical protein
MIERSPRRVCGLAYRPHSTAFDRRCATPICECCQQVPTDRRGIASPLAPFSKHEKELHGANWSDAREFQNNPFREPS